MAAFLVRKAACYADVLVKEGWLVKDSHGLQAAVIAKVRQALAPYTADDPQICSAYEHLVAKLAEKKETA